MSVTYTKPAVKRLTGHGCLEDLVSRHRAAIEKRAYELHEQGIHQGADADWNHAQADILRSVLCP